MVPARHGAGGDHRRDEEVQLRDFKVPLMPEIGSKGKLRTALTPLKDFKTDEKVKDEANAVVDLPLP